MIKSFDEHLKQVDSKEEVYIEWWLDELLRASYIDGYERANSFTLSGPVKGQYTEQLKTKNKITEFTILSGHIYTPDYKVLVSKDSKFFKNANKLYENPNAKKSNFILYFDGEAYLEIKGNFDFKNMTRAFKINQKWLFEKHGKLVNLIKLPDHFKKTFYPKRYLTTDKTSKPRKINGKITTLNKV